MQNSSTEMKIKEHEVSFHPVNFEVSKILQGMFNPNIFWQGYFLIPWQPFDRKRAKVLDRYFLYLFKCSFVDFIEISGIDVQIHTFTEGRLKYPT